MWPRRRRRARSWQSEVVTRSAPPERKATRKSAWPFAREGKVAERVAIAAAAPGGGAWVVRAESVWQACAVPSGTRLIPLPLPQDFRPGLTCSAASRLQHGKVSLLRSTPTGLPKTSLVQTEDAVDTSDLQQRWSAGLSWFAPPGLSEDARRCAGWPSGVQFRRNSLRSLR